MRVGDSRKFLHAHPRTRRDTRSAGLRRRSCGHAPHTALCRPAVLSKSDTAEPPPLPKSMKMPSESESPEPGVWSTGVSGPGLGGEQRARLGFGGWAGGYSLLGQGPEWGVVGPWPGASGKPWGSGQDVISDTECLRMLALPAAAPSASCSATGFSSGVL